MATLLPWHTHTPTYTPLQRAVIVCCPSNLTVMATLWRSRECAEGVSASEGQHQVQQQDSYFPFISFYYQLTHRYTLYTDRKDAYRLSSMHKKQSHSFFSSFPFALIAASILLCMPIWAFHLLLQVDNLDWGLVILISHTVTVSHHVCWISHIQTLFQTSWKVGMSMLCSALNKKVKGSGGVG